MTRFTAYVSNIQRGTSKNNKPYWKVIVQVGGEEHTLWAWDFAKIAQVKTNSTAEFTVEQNGQFMNVETAVPIIDINAIGAEPTSPMGNLGEDVPSFVTETPTGNVLPYTKDNAGPVYVPKYTGGDDRKHSIIRQTAWKVAAALSGGTVLNQEALAEVIAVQRAIEADMLEV